MIIFQKRVAGLNELALDRFVARARRATRLKGTVNVLVTSSLKMRSLNRRFRGKHKPTEVLSFPAGEDSGGRSGGPGPHDKAAAGEIAISCEIACKNARLLGHSPAEEIKILTLHGLLHLSGLDHESDTGEMGERERALRAQFRLPTGLIERTVAGKKSLSLSLSFPLSEQNVKPAKSRKRAQ